MVGTLGRRPERFSLVTAIAFNVPALIWLITVGVLKKAMATSPLATAMMPAGVAR